MIVLGIDPDTKTTGLGLLNDGRPIYAKLVAVAKRTEKIDQRKLSMINALTDFLTDFRIDQPEASQIERIVIEGQRHRPGSPVRPQDLIHLGQVAGALVGICRTLWPGVEILMPEPSDWKGSIRKDIFTRRILSNLDLELDERGGLAYKGSKPQVRVPGTPGLSKRDSSHPIDGLGLAHWGYLRLPLRQS
jgi:hypothetical protein